MIKPKQIVIVGAGETALLAYEYFTYDSEYKVAAVSVSVTYIKDSTLNGLPIVPLEEIEKNYPPSEFEAFIAISSGKLNRIRSRFYFEMKNKGYTLASYVSSKAFVWKSVDIGDNCFILENNTLQPFVKIGNNVTLWSGNHVGHRTIIRDHCFVSSHCVISGFCEIGSNCFLGVNCTLENNVKIAEDNFIGAGALIQKNTQERQFYQPSPTKLSKVNSHRLFRIKE